MAETRPDFQRLQYAFAASIRDPDRPAPVPELAQARLNLYRELLFNNIESLIAAGFPALKSILEGESWRALIRDFFARHRSKTPLFIGIAEEFLGYLGSERGERPEDPPFLLELAHYEWAELALAVSEAEPGSSDVALGRGDPLNAILRLSDLAWPLAYRFPVHRIGPDYCPLEPPATGTFLVIHRDADDIVRFLEINPATYRLLHLLEHNRTLTGQAVLRQIASELRHPDPAAVLAFGASTLGELVERGILETKLPFSSSA